MADGYTKSKFSLDVVIDPAVEGFTVAGRGWNGWATPVFPLESVKEIIRQCDVAVEKFGPEAIVTLTYDAERDVVIEHDANYSPPEPDSESKGFDIQYHGKTVHVYGIGTFGWCWEDVAVHGKTRA